MKHSKHILLGLCVFSFVSTSVVAQTNLSLMQAMDRFEAAQAQSQVEDLWAHQRRRVASRFARAESDHRAEDSALRIEWYLRLGPARSPISLEDLRGVRDSRLMDEVLWSLLNEAVLSSPFSLENNWTGIRATVGSFLKNHPLRQALHKEDHGAWWVWMQDLALKTDDPWDLRLLKNLIQARQKRDPLESLQAYCAASEPIPKDQTSSGIEVAREARQQFPENRVQQRQLLRAAFLKKTPCSRLFSDLAQVYEERKDFELAGEQRSYALLQKLESGKDLLPDELREVGRYAFESEDWDKAFQFYTRVRQTGADDLDARVRELVSASRGGTLKARPLPEAKERFETLLGEAFQSVYRDELLRAYALYLEERGHPADALEVWRWNYQYATQRPQRIEALEKASSLEGAGLDRGDAGYQRKVDVMRWLDLLVALKRLEPRNPQISSQIQRADRRLQRLGLQSEPEIRASLAELRRGGVL